MIQPMRFEITQQVAPMFSPGGPKAWLVGIERGDE